MQDWKEEYKNIEVPENMKDLIEDSVRRGRAAKKRARKMKIIKSVGSMAAVMALVLILPNTSQKVAAAMYQIPVLGDFFKVVTVREYQVDEERYIADVKVPEVVADNSQTEEMQENKEVSEQAQKTAEEINFDIQEVTDELIAQFKSDMEEYEEGYQDLIIDSKVLADDEKWFSLELVLYQGAGSGYERHRHYTIDKITGKQAVLSDFYEGDYVQTISEEVKTQMRQQMEADDYLHYWLDDPEMKTANFEKIAEDQDFYVNADGKVVICFDEYEVAPGYMGCVEFVMP